MTTRDLIALLIAAGTIVGFAAWYRDECAKREAAKAASLSPAAPGKSMWWQQGTPESATVVAPSGKSQWEQYGVLVPYFK